MDVDVRVVERGWAPDATRPNGLNEVHSNRPHLGFRVRGAKAARAAVTQATREFKESYGSIYRVLSCALAVDGYIKLLFEPLGASATVASPAGKTKQHGRGHGATKRW